jgi:hypothetical protein
MSRRTVWAALYLSLVTVACSTARPPEDAPPAEPAPGAPATVGSLTGPRVFDWSSARVTGRATRGVPSAALAAANAPPQPVDWNVTTGAAVNAAAAVWGTAWVEATPDAADQLFFGVNGAGSGKGITGGASATAPNANFFALNNLYATSPTLQWSRTFTSGFDGSAVTLSIDGSSLYALDYGGNLHCMKASDGTSCGDYAGGCAVHGSSPWIDYSSGDIYFGDACGQVHRVHQATATTLTSQWAMKPGASSSYQTAFASSPIAIDGYVYIGDDYGQIFRLTDSSTGPVAGTSSVATFAACSAAGGSAPCGSGWEIRTSVAYDSTTKHVYAAANDYVFELQGGSGTWANTSASPKHLQSGASATMTSAPVLDWKNGYLYTGFNSQLFKIAYPFSGAATVGISSTPLAGGSGASNPPREALPYSWPSNDAVFLGDSAGATERFDCTTQAGTAAIDGQTTTYGTTIATPLIIDYSTGNVNFGYSSATGGGLVQYPLSLGSYTCPSAKPHLCTSSNGPTGTCAATAGGNYGDACRECCVNADCASGVCSNGTCQSGCSGGPGAPGTCASLPNTTATCSAATNGTCSYACTTGFANCDGTIATNGCNVDTASDPSHCGGCGVVCAGANIPVPVCNAGVCGGHCADGYVDCDGDRASNGCERAATCGDCCNAFCAAGSTCYDNGGVGTCVSGQTTQAAAEVTQGSSLSVACPMGQGIAAITFADYGTPVGSGGPGFSPCAGATTSAACSATTLAGYGCSWSGSACAGPACWALGTQADCTSTTGCTWAGTSSTGSCIVSACSGLTQSACGALAGCTWQSALSACTSKLGFVHEYGFGSSTYPPHCGLDVSSESSVTDCQTNNTCTLSAANSVFGTAAPTSSGASLPLSASGSAASGYPSDPCPSITKHLAVQVTCGTCGQSVIAGTGYTDFGITVDAKNIYFTDWYTSSVYSVPKQSNGAGTQTALAMSQGMPSAVATDGSNVYWANTNGPGIMKWSSGGGVSTFATDGLNPEGVTVSGSHLFWSDYNGPNITVTPLSGLSPTVIDNSSLSYNIAVVGSTAYYGATNAGEVRRAPIDGSASPTVLATSANAWDVAADTTNVYWVDVSAGTLSRRASDLSSAAVTMSTGDTNAYGIHIDDDDQSLYWTSYSNGTVRMTRPQGGAPNVTIGNGGGATGIATDATMIYWTNPAANSISKMPKPGPLATSDSAVTNGGALSFWELEDAGPSTATDSVGGRTATVHGTVTFQQAAVANHGTSVSFGGGYLEVPYAAALNPTAFTVGAWINANSGAAKTVVSSRDNTGGTWRGYRLFIDASNVLWAEVGTGTASPTTLTSGTAVTGARAYVAMTYASGTLKVYVNGVLKGTSSVTYSATTTAPLRIGATSEGTASQLYAGRMQEVAVYGRALSASELAQLYTLGNQ